MADSPWIEERETGRWYCWGPGPNGKTIRRYYDELDTTNYQPNNDRSYAEYEYPNPPLSAEQVYEERRAVNPSSSAIGQQYQEVPRTYTSSVSQPQYTPQYRVGGQGPCGVITGFSRGPERQQKHFNSGGYNPGPEPTRGLATYQTVQTSAGRASIGYQKPTYDPNLLAARTAKLNLGELGTSANFRLSHSPPGRGRGSYQAKGKAPAAREPSRHIEGTAGETEKLDRNYRMRNNDWKKFFECGRVFKTLWTDAAGPENENDSEADQFMSKASKARYKVAHGEYVYSKIRRFVVVSRHDRSCQCLPVTTYDGKGYRKRNIKLAEHGLIFTGDRAPEPVSGITMKPLWLRDAVEELDISYINYGRSYCVDTNVKVKDVGVLDGASRRLLRHYYRDIHFPSEDLGIPASIGSTMREDELAGMGGGFSPPQQSFPSSLYPPSGTQYGEELYEDEILTEQPSSPKVDSQYEETRYRPEYTATSSRPATTRTYSTSSSSRPIVQYGRDSEVSREEDGSTSWRPRRESNASSNKHKHR